jgi:hypothetical protein
MGQIGIILLVFAFVLAVLASYGGPWTGRWQLGWGALAFYFASLLFDGPLGHLGR